MTRQTSRQTWVSSAAVTLALAALAPSQAPERVSVEPVNVIVQGHDMAAAAAAVREVGGKVTHELGIIRAVGAGLTPAQMHALRSTVDAPRIFADTRVEVAKKKSGITIPDTGYPTRVGANLLHDEGITGAGVGVAVLDTGWDNFGVFSLDTNGEWRVLKSYDAIQDVIVDLPWRGPVYYPASWGENDLNGHASHLMSIMLSNMRTNLYEPTEPGLYHGLAPDAGVVVVKAFGPDGGAQYADVIRGIDWIVQNKDTYGIRVLNCSFGAPVRSHYWEDPLNQAVMAAWEAGIVVVASAGNTGPDPMTVSVPGNVPYVITVGAMTDNYSLADGSDDRLASFSASGPTYEGFVKPGCSRPRRPHDGADPLQLDALPGPPGVLRRG